jgi:hypothetical protein
VLLWIDLIDLVGVLLRLGLVRPTVVDHFVSLAIELTLLLNLINLLLLLRLNSCSEGASLLLK